MSTRFADHIIGPDIHANRPAANAVPAGTVFACTTHSKLEQSDGVSTWIDYFAGGGSGSVATDAIWDAAGDLALGTGADTAARLPIGSSGKVLQSNGTTASWETPAAVTTIGRSHLVYRYTVTGSDKASIDTGIDTPDAGDNVWTDGDLLELFLYARTDEAALTSGVYLTFNNSSTAIYDRQFLSGNNASVSSGASIATSGVEWEVDGASQAANYFSGHRAEVPNFTGVVGYKHILSHSGTAASSAANGQVFMGSHVYRDTAAITRAKIIPITALAKLKVGTQLLIYKRLAS